MSIKIALNHGKEALIDDEDAVAVNAHTWHAVRIHNTWYAASRTPRALGHRRLYMHRIVLGVDGLPVEVDHVNGDGLDNRRCNLRCVSHSFNIAKQRRAKPPLSGLRGVYYNPTVKRWYARMKVEGRKIHLGSYGTAEEAGRAYDAYAVRRLGADAVLNFPGENASLYGGGENNGF